MFREIYITGVPLSEREHSQSMSGTRTFNLIWFFCGFIKDWSGSKEFHLGNLAHTYSSQ